MKRIRNIVFDLGGVLIDLDHHQAVSRFEEIGVKDAKQLLDPYEQKGFFLELENGKSSPTELRLFFVLTLRKRRFPDG